MKLLDEMVQPLRVVILGGGFAGLECARTLKDRRFAVTLVDRENHHLFQPLLYQVATAGLSAPEIAQPIRMLVRDQENTAVLMDEAIGIDLVTKQVTLKKQILPYDYLVLAMGVRTSYLEAGFEKSRRCHAHPLAGVAGI